MRTQILQLSELLSMNHPSVMKTMEACAADTEKYCKEHQQEYEILACLDGTVAKEDYACIQWIILIECLMKYDIAALLDWKCELENFAGFIKGLAGKRKYKLTFRTAWFDEEESLEEWCAVLNAKWQPSGACLVQLDLDSDSYILLPVLSVQFEIVQTLAAEIGMKITSADADNPPFSSGILHDFFKRHPYTPSANRTPLPVSCEQCFTDDALTGNFAPCKLSENQLFQTIVNAQPLSPKQILTVSKRFRMKAMEVRERLSAGKDLYVKAYLADTLVTMAEFEKQQISCEILPASPIYPHFRVCPKKTVRSGGNDYKYFQFDRERKTDWDK